MADAPRGRVVETASAGRCDRGQAARDPLAPVGRRQQRRDLVVGFVAPTRARENSGGASATP
jgi:hypothetical protein